MNKLFFRNDYGEGAHPIVLQRLIETNMEHTCGYGMDHYSLEAAEMIKEKCGQPKAEVHMMTGGTSANVIALSAFLRPYEAVIAAPTGHINVHETGAIEASGHKILLAETRDAKILPESIDSLCIANSSEHMVHPAAVYISQSTELGSVYTLSELRALREACDRNDLILFMDGARLGSALTSAGCDVTLKDIAALTDAFYIGGTKNGLLFGEAMVITNPALQKNFRFMIKNRGGMMAKGRLCGVMFLAMLENDAWLDWAAHANAMADKVRSALVANGFDLYQNNTTNQIFPIMTARQESKLAELCEFEHQETLADGRVVIRFVTSWATSESDTDALCEIIGAL